VVVSFSEKYRPPEIETTANTDISDLEKILTCLRSFADIMFSCISWNMEPGYILIFSETALLFLLIGSMIFVFWRGAIFFFFLLIGSQHKIVQNSTKPNNKNIRSNTLPEEKHANENREERVLNTKVKRKTPSFIIPAPKI
jgi:hypothetical protein